jgi:hypothetical protein
LVFTVTQAATVVIILIPISVFILAILVLLLLRPALASINKERTNALKLFLAIPKGTISVIYNMYSDSNKEDTIKDYEDEAYQVIYLWKNSEGK